jgi:hypothetical protein
MSQVPIRTSPFEPLGVYDAPEQVFSLVWDREFTTDAALATFFDPSKLTPKERNGVARRLKDAAGGGSITNALVDIATNPLIWFWVVTTPIGTTAIGRGAKSLVGSMKAKHSAFVLEQAGWLGAFKTPQQVLERTVVGAAQAQIASRTFSRNAIFAKRFERPLHDVLARYNLPHLDWQTINDPVKRARAREISDVLTAKRMRMWENTAERVTVVKDGVPVQEVVQHPALVASRKAVDDKVASLGLGNLSKAIDDHFDDSATLIFGDEDRLRRIFNVLQNRSIRGGATLDVETIQGAEIARQFLGPMSEQVALGKVSFIQFREALENTIRAPVSVNRATYMPRNLFDDIINGEVLDQNAWVQRRGNPISAVRPAPSVFNRKRFTLHHHPDDLNSLRKTFGNDATAELSVLIEDAEKLLNKTRDASRSTRFLRINAMEQVAKHHNATTRMLALSDAPNAEVLAAHAAIRNETGLGGKKVVQVLDPKSVGGAGYSSVSKEAAKKLGLDDVTVPVQSLENAPPGGWAVTDLIEADWKALNHNGYAQRVITDIVMPQALGVAQPKSMAVQLSLIQAKHSARALADSGLGDAIAKTGERGKRFVGSLKNWADRPTTLADAQGLSRAVAGTLYVSHLGVNMGSVILNMTQPFLLGPVILGERHVLKGYAKGVKEMLDYGAERARRYGFKPITKLQRDELVRAHFKYGEESGLLATSFELLDDVTSRQVRGNIGRGPLAEQIIFEYPMKLFEKAEWLNRSVTAHAVESFYRTKGLALDAPEFITDVRRIVDETQFGAGVRNTPVIFQATGRAADLSPTGGFFAGPVMRQFLSFQTRSFTSPFAFTSKLAGTTRTFAGRDIELGRAGASAFDIMRGIGFSALVYEVGKNVLGLDLSRGLFFSAQTDVLPGFESGRFSAREGPLPVPPAIDLAYGLAIGLATQDAELLGRNASRLIPGGIAARRLTQVFGRAPLPKGVQPRYVGWQDLERDAETGRLTVPVFDGPSGNLIGREAALDVMLRALGIPVGRQTQEAERALLAGRETALQITKAAVDALQANDMDAFEGAGREFEKRFGFPMRLNRQKLVAAARLRESPRMERILDSIPADVRQEYTDAFVATLSRSTGLPPEVIVQHGTATSRRQAVGNEGRAAMVAELEGRLEEFEGRLGGSKGRTAFDRFEGLR